jgi:hypothetical protein
VGEYDWTRCIHFSILFGYEVVFFACRSIHLSVVLVACWCVIVCWLGIEGKWMGLSRLTTSRKIVHTNDYSLLTSFMPDHTFCYMSLFSFYIHKSRASSFGDAFVCWLGITRWMIITSAGSNFHEVGFLHRYSLLISSGTVLNPFETWYCLVARRSIHINQRLAPFGDTLAILLVAQSREILFLQCDRTMIGGVGLVNKRRMFRV